MTRLRLWTSLIAIVCCLPAVAQPPKAASDPVLVTVNGQPIRESHLKRILQTRRIPAKLHEQLRTQFMNELIDAEVLRQYLADRQALPSRGEVDQAVKEFKIIVTKGSAEPEKALTAAGFTDEVLREQVTLPLAWQKYVERVFTLKSVQDYYAKNHERFDGTQIRARHIFLKMATDTPSAELTAAEQKLAAVREEILAGKISFEDAARKYSDGPSAKQGGDLGLFTWRGKMPESFCKVAFRLKAEEISEPLQSPFGLHICTVIERKPGNAEFEDVREEVLRQMAQDLWVKTAAEQRGKAKLEWKKVADAK